MKDQFKTKQVLIQELVSLRQRIQELERSKTEWKMAEEVLKDSESKYQFLAENMADVVYSVDLNLKTTYVSPSIEKLLGYTPQERMAQKTGQQLTPKSQNLVFETLSAELSREKEKESDLDRSKTLELEYYHKDGSIKHLLTYIRGIRDSEGNLTGFYGSSHDITERKLAEEAFHREYSFRNAIIDNISEGLCVCHETLEYPFLRFTIWNDHMTKITGYTMEEINRLGWYQTVYPDADLQAMAIERMKRMRQSKDLHGEEWEIIRADGGKRIFNISTSVVESEDSVMHVLAIMQDNTERKRAREALRMSETRYRLLAENATDVIWTVGMDMQLTYASPSVTKLLGFTVEEAMARTMQQAFTSAAFEKAMQIFGEEMVIENTGDSDPTRSRVLELELFRKDGDIVPVEGHFCFLRDPAGKAIGILAIMRDITERKQAEAEKEKLEMQNRQLQKAESLSRMAGAIAHNFNNHLGAVIGFIELATQSISEPAESARFLNGALRAAFKAADMSGLMLTYLGQTRGKCEPIDLSVVSRRSLSMIQAAMPVNVMLNTDLPSPGPTISANAKQIQQVLTNLVTNACEAIGESPGVINLTIKTVSVSDIPTAYNLPVDWKPQQNTYACIEVTDTGCGIADEEIEKIFDPFFSSKFTGRGLGLPVVLGVVRERGGVITVESSPGGGSIFRVFFPNSTESVSRQQEKVYETSGLEGCLTILLVEDEAAMRKMAKEMLKRMGHIVYEAKDGVDAIEVFRAHKDEIRIVLCDLTMPRMDGWETLAALRALRPDIPFVLSSGYEIEKVMVGDHSELPQAFLGKPYMIDGLRDALHLAMAKKS